MKAPFVCLACFWTDALAVPSDKPRLDVVEGWCCTGCGQDGMTMHRIYGIDTTIAECDAEDFN